MDIKELFDSTDLSLYSKQTSLDSDICRMKEEANHFCHHIVV